jgi:hypothetical protein
MLKSLGPDELQFIGAIETFKNKVKHLFLSWTQVLKIVTGLGYVKPGMCWVITDRGWGGEMDGGAPTKVYYLHLSPLGRLDDGDGRFSHFWTHDKERGVIFRMRKDAENTLQLLVRKRQNQKKEAGVEVYGVDTGLAMELAWPAGIAYDLEGGAEKLVAHVEGDDN